MLHRGEMIEKAIRESGIPISLVAKRLGKSRRWMYNAFEIPDLSLDIIMQIGKIIHTDFSKMIPVVSFNNTLNDSVNNGYAHDADYWRDKYYTLLEDYHELMKKLNGQK